ncbi:MAG: RsmE family RNA methyltransferase [Phycisphaerae bacterium]
MAAGRVRIDAAEAHHLRDVLRLVAGDAVELFDGAGAWASGQIVECGPDGVTVEVAGDVQQEAASGGLTLAVSPPKGSRAEWMVEKLAELGVCEWIPLRTERTVMMPAAGRLARWRRVCVAAAKQSRQSAEMRVGAPAALTELLAERGRTDRLLLADVGGAELHAALARGLAERWLAIVGPEGGLTAAEKEQVVRAGGQCVRLARAVLRVETAAVALASVWAGAADSRG